jgi:hypothetical protein
MYGGKWWNFLLIQQILMKLRQLMI